MIKVRNLLGILSSIGKKLSGKGPTPLSLTHDQIVSLRNEARAVGKPFIEYLYSKGYREADREAIINAIRAHGEITPPAETQPFTTVAASTSVPVQVGIYSEGSEGDKRMDKITLWINVIFKMGLLAIGIGLVIVGFIFAQNGRYVKYEGDKASWAVLDTKAGAIYVYYAEENMLHRLELKNGLLSSGSIQQKSISWK